jgi:uncharacterized protein (DUF58 family)
VSAGGDRGPSARRLAGTLARWGPWALLNDRRMAWTREGIGYFAIWLGLLVIGLYQQLNLVLLIAGLAAGPIVSSVLVSSAMLRRLSVTRRAPSYVFSGGTLEIDYTLENGRRSTAALAVALEDELVPIERGGPGSHGVSPRVMFARVPAGGRERLRWKGTCPDRGTYSFRSIDMVTRSPFGLMEKRETTYKPVDLIVYPMVGQLERAWRQLHRQSTETKRGRRSDRSAHQQEYHGLRDYRPGDSPRWIHWRTSARIGLPMVKEFEQQSDQDMAVLLDPWLPRSKVTAEQREALEEAIRFAATVCLDICRRQGRRLLLGWTGPTPGVRQGPASVKLLHELLGQLAVMRPTPEGQMSALLDAVPPSMLREALLILVSTRPIQLSEEVERSRRLATSSGRGLAGRAIVLDASRGQLKPFVKYHDAPGAIDLLRDSTGEHATASPFEAPAPVGEASE